MNVAALKDLFLEAETRVARGQRMVRLQRRIVTDLERDGRDTNEAREVLVALEEIEAILVESRDRIGTVWREQAQWTE
jgi:hypothetical protein